MDEAGAMLSGEKARLLVQDVERRCRRRWVVMWEPYRQVFTAYPMYDFEVHTPVEAETARKLWLTIAETDRELFRVAVDALPAHPPTIGRVSSGFLLREVSG